MACQLLAGRLPLLPLLVLLLLRELSLTQQRGTISCHFQSCLLNHLRGPFRHPPGVVYPSGCPLPNTNAATTAGDNKEDGGESDNESATGDNEVHHNGNQCLSLLLEKPRRLCLSSLLTDRQVPSEGETRTEDNESLSLKLLSLKLAMLMSLTSASRVSKLQALDLRFRQYTVNGMVFKLASLTKKCQTGAP